MGELYLCSHALAMIPYYMESAGLNIYSLEELCYYLSRNPDFADATLLDDELIDWIRAELKLPALAGRLAKHKENGDLPGFAVALAFAVNSCGEAEIEHMREAIAAFSDKSEAECRKIRADRLLEKKRYGAGILEYRKLLGLSEAEGLAGDLYHNLGTAYAGLFLFEEAAECYGKAYEKNKSLLSARQRDIARKLAHGILPEEEEDGGELPQELIAKWKADYAAACR